MGLSWNQTKLLQGGFASLNYNNNQQKEARIIALDSQINTLQQRIATLNNSNANNKAERIAEYKNKLEQLTKEKIELEKGMANTNIETPFNIFSKNTDETSTQEATIAAKDISNEAILANSGVSINKAETEKVSENTVKNNSTTEKEDKEKTELEEARKTYTEALTKQQQAIKKLNAYATQYNFPRSTANLPGLAASQVRLEDMQAGRLENFKKAMENNTSEYQEYQKLAQSVGEASRGVVEAKTKLENARSSALQKANEIKKEKLKLELEKVEAQRLAIENELKRLGF